MKQKKIKKLAEQIMTLEESIDKSNSVESQQEIERIMLSLSMDDTLQLVSYLFEQFGFKKDF